MERARQDIEAAWRPVRGRLPRPMVVAEPFYGLGGYRELSKVARLEYVNVNMFMNCS